MVLLVSSTSALDSIVHTGIGIVSGRGGGGWVTCRRIWLEAKITSCYTTLKGWVGESEYHVPPQESLQKSTVECYSYIFRESTVFTVSKGALKATFCCRRICTKLVCVLWNIERIVSLLDLVRMWKQCLLNLRKSKYRFRIPNDSNEKIRYPMIQKWRTEEWGERRLLDIHARDNQLRSMFKMAWSKTNIISNRHELWTISIYHWPCSFLCRFMDLTIQRCIFMFYYLTKRILFLCRR